MLATNCMAAGLSPRVRGKHPLVAHKSCGMGSIPACAGETEDGDLVDGLFQVYPRVCGGNVAMRWDYVPWWGLSPRVRGKLGNCPVRRELDGSIPACAGETPPGFRPGE